MVLIKIIVSEDIREWFPVTRVLQCKGPGFTLTPVRKVHESLDVRVGEFEKVVDLHGDQLASGGGDRESQGVGDSLQQSFHSESLLLLFKEECMIVLRM